jgi:hypothetical protein
MSADSTIAARVTAELRNDLEAHVARLRGLGVHYPDGREVDRSFVIRQALRAYLDGEARLEPGREPGLFDSTDRGEGRLRWEPLAGPGTARRADPETAKAAARQDPGRKGSQRRRALEAFEAAGAKGLTTDQVVVELTPAPHNGVARRVTDLLQAGLIEPIPREPAMYGDDTRPPDVIESPWVTRETRTGTPAMVWRITGQGLVELGKVRRAEAERVARETRAA